jgi:hypothetical protein
LYAGLAGFCVAFIFAVSGLVRPSECQTVKAIL